MTKIKLDWEDFGIKTNTLIDKVKADNIKYDGVYGVPRGGLALALSFSHALDIPLLAYPTNESLVVDDISDTGETLMYVKRKRIATLYTTPWTITEPDYHVSVKENKSDWIVYPWELK